MIIRWQLAACTAAVTLASAITAGAQDKAAEILQQAQQALGGEALRSIASLSVEGPFRRDVGGRHIEGTIAITIELPGKMHRSEDIELPGGMSVERISVLAGETSWEDTRNRGGVGGGVQIVLRSPEGRELNPELVEQARLARLRSQLTRHMLAFLGGVHQQATYVAVSESPDGRADVIEVKDARGQAVRLFVDQESRLPLMMQYNEVRPRAMMGGPDGGRGMGPRGQGGAVIGRGRGVDPEEVRRRVESMPPPEPSLVTLFLSDFQNVDGVLLPHTLVEALDGKPVEEWTIRRARLNPPIKASLFEQ
jgi:hypothetical protein